MKNRRRKNEKKGQEVMKNMTQLLKEKQKERTEQRKWLERVIEKERIAKISRLAEGLFPRYPAETVEEVGEKHRRKKKDE